MPFNEATFWIGLTVAGTGFYFLVEGEKQRRLSSLIVTIIGAAAVVYSVYVHDHPGFTLRPYFGPWSLPIEIGLPLGALLWRFLISDWAKQRIWRPRGRKGLLNLRVDVPKAMAAQDKRLYAIGELATSLGEILQTGAKAKPTTEQQRMALANKTAAAIMPVARKFRREADGFLAETVRFSSGLDRWLDITEGVETSDGFSEQQQIPNLVKLLSSGKKVLPTLKEKRQIFEKLRGASDTLDASCGAVVDGFDVVISATEQSVATAERSLRRIQGILERYVARSGQRAPNSDKPQQTPKTEQPETHNVKRPELLLRYEPPLFAELAPDSAPTTPLLIQNAGDRPARQIEIDPVFFSGCVARFQPPTDLVQNEPAREVRVLVTLDDESTTGKTLGFALDHDFWHRGWKGDQEHSPRWSISVRYRDAVGTAYEDVFELLYDHKTCRVTLGLRS